MLVHSVFFWLKAELTEAQAADFRAGLESLATVPSVHAVYIGTPAPTDRPVIDRSYSYALTVLLDGMAEHDQYQEDPIHRAFVKDFSGHWDRVLIYDAI